LLAWARDAGWQVAGFLDRNPEALSGFDLDVPVVGDPESYGPAAEEVFACAIGEPRIKLSLARALQQRGARFVNVIHPTAIVGPGNRLGVGIILCPYAVITTNVTLGDFVSLNLHGTIGHDATIGPGCTLNDHTDVTGGACLGEGVFLGSHASVLPGARVGDYARIGAGSTVVRSAKAGTTIVGVPGRRLPLLSDAVPASAGSNPGIVTTAKQPSSLASTGDSLRRAG
jgi:sugar O-acyltransferase (sialic acid O-acetyltransferase NeuD family)